MSWDSLPGKLMFLFFSIFVMFEGKSCEGKTCIYQNSGSHSVIVRVHTKNWSYVLLNNLPDIDFDHYNDFTSE